MSDKTYDPVPNHAHTCGECVRFGREREGGKRNCIALYGPEGITADRKACKRYLDKAQREREEREQEEQAEKERLKRWEKNENNPERSAKWKRGVDYCSGKRTGAMPFCPNCDEPLYDVERCFFCGQKITQNKRMNDYKKPPEVRKMDCIFCGAKDGVEYIVSRYNGHRSGHCIACGMRFIE